MTPPLRDPAGPIARADRERRLGQRGTVVWFTGLSGAGKSTIARAVERALHGEGRLVYVLDGDEIRRGLCQDLGFSAADRSENIRRVGHVAALFADAGAIVLVAFLSPFRADRAAARAVIGPDFLEVFVDAPLAVCEQRDPKGHYQRARTGRLPGFTGVDAPYEPPERPDLRLPTASQSADASAKLVVDLLRARDRLSAPEAP